MVYCIREKIRKARYDHVCWGCHGHIRKGSQYRAGIIANSGEIYTWKSCNQCETLLEELADDYRGEEYYRGDLYEDHTRLWPRTQIVNWTFKNIKWLTEPEEYVRRYNLIKEETTVDNMDSE